MNSPLVYDRAMSGSLRAYARANQCPVIVPFILGGATGPVSMAGAVAQSMAEVMAGVALGQLERPGSPAVFGNFLTTVNLKTGSPTFGTPEAALGSYAAAQLARRIGLPLRCSGAFTSSKIPDAQAVQESATSLHTALLSGIDGAPGTRGAPFVSRPVNLRPDHRGPRRAAPPALRTPGRSESDAARAAADRHR